MYQFISMFLGSFMLIGCTSHVQIINETAMGGVALYTYVEEHDVLTSPERHEALHLLEQKCPAGYKIAREGEVAQINAAIDRAWSGQLSRDGQVSREKYWAIQFACK